MGLCPPNGRSGEQSIQNHRRREIESSSADESIPLVCSSPDIKSDHSDSTSFKAQDPPMPLQREAWTARGQLLLNFHDAISQAINSPEMIEKCSRIASQMSSVTNRCTYPVESNNLADDYSAEANLIIENKAKRDAEVRMKTGIVGLCTFAVMRGGRGVSRWTKLILSNRTGASQYRFDSLSAPNAAVEKSTVHQQLEQPTKFRRFFRLGVDVSISTAVAIFMGTFLFVPRPSCYIEDMSNLPLVEGKSLYAEMVCPPLLREYKRVLDKYGGWPVMKLNSDNANGSNALTQEDVSLNIIRKFAENCTKRSKYERALLEERYAISNPRGQASGSGLIHRLTGRLNHHVSPDESIKLGTVMVPSGGVPDDLHVDLEEDILLLIDEADS